MAVSEKCEKNGVHRWTQWSPNGNDHFSRKCMYCGVYDHKYGSTKTASWSNKHGNCSE